VRLDDSEVQAAYYGICGFIRQCSFTQRSVPPEVLFVRQRLDAHIRLSRARHESGCEATTAARSEVWIGATATASMLGRGLRYVQRHAEDIGVSSLADGSSSVRPTSSTTSPKESAVIVELDPEVEQQLADMSDEDYRALIARVRPPSSTTQHNPTRKDT
jgi:hypothetical protein